MFDLSVVIPVLNAAHTVGHQLHALATQVSAAGFAWNVLLCDNGSTDGTRQLARQYDQVPGLQVLDAGGVPGAAHARNVGVASTDAPWIAFCDADDVVAPDWVAQMALALPDHPFVAGPLCTDELNSPRVASSRKLPQQRGLQASAQGYPHASSSNMGIHRDVFLRCGGFDETLPGLEDTELCWRVQEAGFPLTFQPRIRAQIRLRTGLAPMWRQGRNYGASAAELDRRYPPPPAATGPNVSGVSELLSVAHRPSAALWKLGWHTGYRWG